MAEQLANADYYLSAGDRLLEAGDRAGPRTYWEKIAAVGPSYPGLAARLRKLGPQAGDR